MPFVSRAQQRFAFGTHQSWAKRWAKQTNFKRLPYKKRKKAYSLDQLEAFVSSPAYDSDTASLIALGIPELPAFKGESIAPGITRIHGNLCNVHGKYGPCDKALSGKRPKGGKRAARKPRQPRKTPAQRIAERATLHAANTQKVLAGLNIAPDGQQALLALRSGAQPDPKAVARGGFEQAGLVERASDGSYRMSASGRAALAAASAGDAGRAGDIISSARDRLGARTQREQTSATRHEAARQRREQTAAARAKRQQAKKKEVGAVSTAVAPHGPGGLMSAPGMGGTRRAKRKKRMTTTTKDAASPGDYLVVEDPAKSSTWHLQVKRNGKVDHGLMGSAWAALHSGFRGNVYQGSQKGAALSKLKKLYASEGMDVPTTKTASFTVFKNAAGQYRWIAYSSNAYQDRDNEIVSTKALNDDCDYADRTGWYGPLRYWHTPGLDLGDCDFNVMHGRVLIESGTFRSDAIARKVAQSADESELSLGFFHLPTDPDADGVYHQIRRFERSLVPRGKAANLFTAFTVKEMDMATLEERWESAKKQFGFDDADLTTIQSGAEAKQKDAETRQIAYKADDPEADTLLPDLVINGIVYKAAPAGLAAPSDGMIEGSPEEEAAESPEEEAVEPDAQDAGGLTLSPEDLDAIGQAISAAMAPIAAQIMGGLDLEKKVGAHVQGMMAPYQQAQATKDASNAEKAEQIAALQVALKANQDALTLTQTKLDDLLGLQPVTSQRPSQSAPLNPFNPADAALLATIKDQLPPDQRPINNDSFDDLRQRLFGV